MASLTWGEPLPAFDDFGFETSQRAVKYLAERTGFKASTISSIGVGSWNYRPQYPRTVSTIARLLWLRSPRIPDTVLQLRLHSFTEDADRLEVQDKVKSLSKEIEKMRSSVMPCSMDPIPVMRLNLKRTGLKCAHLLQIAALTYGHATLTHLDLKENSFESTQADMWQKFGHAISLSNLRQLDISHNRLGPRRITAFLDSLHSLTLSHLDITQTMLRSDLSLYQKHDALWQQGDQEWNDDPALQETVWENEIKAVTESLIRLIGDATRAPRAPRLLGFFAGYNNLGWASIEKIVQTILTSNFHIEVVDLHQSSLGAEGDAEDHIPHQPHIYIPRKRDINLVEDFNRFSATVTRENYGHLLLSACEENACSKRTAENAGCRLLRIARTLNCRSRFSTEVNKISAASSSQSFRFTDLPSELRKKIIMQLDENDILSQRQVEQVFAFASDPSTIGYGSNSAHFGLTTSILTSVQKEKQLFTSSHLGFVPHKGFSWSEMIQKRSMPRDWPAEVFTTLRSGFEWQCSSSLLDVTRIEQKIIGNDEKDLYTAFHGQLSTLSKQQELRDLLSDEGAMQAFLEATGTFCAECPRVPVQPVAQDQAMLRGNKRRRS